MHHQDEEEETLDTKLRPSILKLKLATSVLCLDKDQGLRDRFGMDLEWNTSKISLKQMTRKDNANE